VRAHTPQPEDAPDIVLAFDRLSDRDRERARGVEGAARFVEVAEPSAWGSVVVSTFWTPA
jgi:hypothetical protein